MKRILFTLFAIIVFLQSINAVAQTKEQRVSYWHRLNAMKYFGDISANHTLLLTAYFDDCGEFGGHKETIEIVGGDTSLIAVITVYEKSCQQRDGKYPEAKILTLKSYLIDSIDINHIEKYLVKIFQKSMQTMGLGFGNSGTEFTAKYSYKESANPNLTTSNFYNTDFYVRCRDYPLEYKRATIGSEFQDLKKKLEN